MPVFDQPRECAAKQQRRNHCVRVEHDPRYARHAERSIHLFDGRVVEEDAAHGGLKDLEESGFDMRG